MFLWIVCLAIIFHSRMKSLFPPHFLEWIELNRKKVTSFETFPFCLPLVRSLDRLELHPEVTFLVGENGSGKSTLLEAIAVAWGFNAEGGSKNFAFETRASHSDLHHCLRLARGVQKPTDGFFLRAESFYNVASYVEGIGVTGYGTKSLHEQSHGESFWSLFMNRFRGNGFYILDEPEAALSPSRQMALLARMHDLVRRRSQFIIATHSPLIMAFPNAAIYQLANDKIERVRYQDTDHYLLTKRFLDNPERYMAKLFEDEKGSNGGEGISPQRATTEET
jgi:predicted ATPase